MAVMLGRYTRPSLHASRGFQAWRWRQPQPIAVENCRSVWAWSPLKHHRMEKFVIPTEDAAGKPITRSPNGVATRFELCDEGSLNEKTQDSYWWSEHTNFQWTRLFLWNCFLGFWSGYIFLNYGEHIFVGDFFIRKRYRDEAIAAYKAAEEAGDEELLS